MNIEQPQNDEKKPLFEPIRAAFLGSKNEPSQADNPADTQPAVKQVQVGGVSTNMIGKSAESKQGPPQELREPEEVLYSWQAPEFIATQKPAGWYLGLVGFFGALGIIAIIFKLWSTIPIVVLFPIVLSIWGNRKPRILDYAITNYGITIGNKEYDYDSFKSFYQYMDYNQETIDLVPSKRFGVLVSLPLIPQEADEIKETISHMIPEIEHREDPIDAIFRRLRF